MNRSRLVYRQYRDAGSNINLVETPPWNSTLIQIGIHYSVAPTDPDIFYIYKRSISGPNYDLQLYRDNPSIFGAVYDVFPCSFEFVRGDQVEATYNNGSGITIAIELIFQEGQ